MSKWVEGHHPNRNTKRYHVQLGSLDLFFSYDTLIGMAYGPLELHARRENIWGPTTGRHIREYCIHGWPEVSEDELQGMVSTAVQHMGMEMFKHTLEGKEAA